MVNDPDYLSTAGNDCILTNAKAMNVLFNALSINEFNRVCKLSTVNEICTKLVEAHEGTSTVKGAKLFIFKGKFEKFAMLPNEDPHRPSFNYT